MLVQSPQTGKTSRAAGQLHDPYPFRASAYAGAVMTAARFSWEKRVFLIVFVKKPPFKFCVKNQKSRYPTGITALLFKNCSFPFSMSFSGAVFFRLMTFQHTINIKLRQFIQPRVLQRLPSPSPPPARDLSKASGKGCKYLAYFSKLLILPLALHQDAVLSSIAIPHSADIF